ncbi:hypothetical protein LT330_002370 [Penicillium expansum]|nr:hypothetical protein LT330_002370 [Penicillium expansum]
MKGFIGGIPVALLAVAAQAKFAERHEHDFHPQAGGTAIGGPSGNDNDGGFVSPYSASIKTDTQVNEWNKDDHSIKLKHTDVYPRPPVVPVPFGYRGPQAPGKGPFGKGKRSAPGGTAIGGPSGNDEGQSFDLSVTGIFNTAVADENKDDHSINIKSKHVYPPAHGVVHPPPQFNGPPRGGYHGPASPPSTAFNTPTEGYAKRFGPHAGGTAIGGPSGNDGGQSFSFSTDIETSTDVTEHNEDDHSIGVTREDIYPQPHAHAFAPFRRSENYGPPGHGGAPPPVHFEPHPEPHYEPHTESHYEPHSEPHYEPHPEPHFENHPEPHVENHPEPHYSPSYSPSYEPHYEPHTTFDYELTSLKNNNNGPAAGSISFGRRGFPAGPAPHIEPHPEPHFAPHAETHYAPHSEPHYAPHPEPHFENHPEPHFENHPEPHYSPSYSPSYEPHYEPHTTFESEITSLKNNNNGPAAGSISFSRRGFPAGPAPHIEPHPEPHFAPHTETHYAPHSEPHYEPHPEPHFENHPEPHFENHPEPHYSPSYSPSYEPHYEPHTTFESEITSLENNNNGPAAGSIAFGRRAYAPTRETPVGGGTAIGGPSGDSDASGFSAPTSIDVTTGVNEHNEDNHSIKGDWTHVHPDGPAEYSPEDKVEGPQCAAQVHEVVHTVTKTQYKTAEVTQVAYQSAPAVDGYPIPGYATQPHSAGADAYAPPARAPSSAAAEHPSYAIPPTDNLIPAHVPMAAPSTGTSPVYGSYPQNSAAAVPYPSYPQQSAGADPYDGYPKPSSTGVDSYAGYPEPSTGADSYSGYPQQSAGADPYAGYAGYAGYAKPSSTGVDSYSGYTKPSTGADPYAGYLQPSAGADPYAAQRPSYSKIAVHVPMATPASYGAFSKATPSNSMGKMIPTGVSAEQKASPSSSASASVSHGIMFQGSAARLSGGIVTAAAAAMGVLAFIL